MNKKLLITALFIAGLFAFHYFFDLKNITEKVQIAPGNNEAFYNAMWCDRAGGNTEHVLQDKTRVDCLTGELAVETDFAHKWYEAVGQSLHYARMTGKKAAIILILKQKKDEKYLKALTETVSFYRLPIIIYSINAY